MTKFFRAFRDRYLAACFLLIGFFIAGSSSAQVDTTKVRQKINAYGYDYKNVSVDTSFGIPRDTFKLKYNQDTNFLAIKGRTIYNWNGSYWVPFAKKLNDTTVIIGADTVKVGGTGGGGGSTNLTMTRNGTTVTITPSSGTAAVIPAATTSNAGIMTAAMKSTLDSAFTHVTVTGDSITCFYRSGTLIRCDTVYSTALARPLYAVDSRTIGVKNDSAAWNAAKIQGRAVSSTAPTDGQAIVWDNGAGTWKPGTVSGGGGSVTGKLGVIVSGGEAYADSTYRAPTAKTLVTYTSTNKRTDASSIIRLNDGSLYLATTAFGSASGDNDSAVIVSYRSFDNGRTWIEKDTVAAMSGTGVYIPSLYYNNSSDTLRVLYYRQNSTTTGQIYGAYSVDNGESWSAGALVYGSGTEYYSPASDRVFRLKNGTLLFPFAINTNGTLTSSTGNYRGRLLSSTNGGATWSLVSGVDIGSPDSLCVEPGVFQTDDQYNLVTFYFRTRSGYVGFAKSTDSSATAFSAGYLSALPAPNSTTTMLYDEEHKVIVAAHNRYRGSSFINGIGGRYIMDLSVSPGNDITNSWFPVLRIDSATNRHFIEPTITKLRSNELLVTYSNGDAYIGDTFNLAAKIIPLNYIKNADVSVVTGIKVRKPLNGTSSDLAEFYTTSLSETSNFYKLGNQTSGSTFFAPWWRLATVRSQGDMLLHNVEAPTSINGGSFYSFDATTSSSSVANTQRIFSVKNNGSNKFDVFGDGRIRLASYAGDVTSPANGDIWYNSSTNKFRAYQNGTLTDLIGAGGGGSFIASNGATTLSGNVDITQGSNRFSLNEQLLIGTNTVIDASYMLQINKVSTAQTTAYMGNVGSNSNGNEFRFIKQTATNGYDISSSTWVGAFNGNTIGKFGLIAGNDLASDNYRNLDFLFQSRTGIGSMSERFRVTNDGHASITKRGGTGSVISFFSIFQGDQSTSTPVFKIDNGTTGTGGGAPFIYTNSLGTLAGYGLPFDVNTTAATDGVSFNLRNSASAISNGNWLFRVANNGTNRFGVKGNGDIYAAGISAATSSDTKILVKGASDSIVRQLNFPIVQGTYTATKTDVTNIGTATVSTLHYQRLGDYIEVGGEITIDPTAIGDTHLRITLPIASTITNSYDLFGTASAYDVNQVVRIYGDTVNSAAIFRLTAADASSHVYSFKFRYKYVAP